MEYNRAVDMTSITRVVMDNNALGNETTRNNESWNLGALEVHKDTSLKEAAQNLGISQKETKKSVWKWVFVKKCLRYLSRPISRQSLPTRNNMSVLLW